MSRGLEYVGCLAKTTADGARVRVQIYRRGRYVELRRDTYEHSVHPMNRANVDGWIREIDVVWQTGLDGWEWER